mmetsp:Transcript_15986/g.36586  ORF Transcript_15986/g.36586 Transcript_15986/m.36586 type:complete len:208 (-) Transcript_15986:3340-3963(-)
MAGIGRVRKHSQVLPTIVSNRTHSFSCICYVALYDTLRAKMCGWLFHISLAQPPRCCFKHVWQVVTSKAMLRMVQDLSSGVKQERRACISRSRSCCISGFSCSNALVQCCDGIVEGSNFGGPCTIAPSELGLVIQTLLLDGLQSRAILAQAFANASEFLCGLRIEASRLNELCLLVLNACVQHGDLIQQRCLQCIELSHGGLFVGIL